MNVYQLALAVSFHTKYFYCKLLYHYIVELYPSTIIEHVGPRHMSKALLNLVLKTNPLSVS